MPIWEVWSAPRLGASGGGVIGDRTDLVPCDPIVHTMPPPPPGEDAPICSV